MAINSPFSLQPCPPVLPFLPHWILSRLIVAKIEYEGELIFYQLFDVVIAPNLVWEISDKKSVDFFIRLNWGAFIKANGLDWKFQWCHLMNKNQQYRHLSLVPRPRQWYILSLRNSKYHKGCNNVLRAVVNPRHMMVLDAFKALCWQRERKIGCQY